MPQAQSQRLKLKGLLLCHVAVNAAFQPARIKSLLGDGFPTDFSRLSRSLLSAGDSVLRLSGQKCVPEKVVRVAPPYRSGCLPGPAPGVASAQQGALSWGLGHCEI